MYRSHSLTKILAVTFFLGIILGLIAGFLIGNVRIGLFLFLTTFFLIGVGHYWDSIQSQYSTLQIGSKSIHVLRFKPWRLSFFPVVIINVFVDIIFAYHALGGDPSRWPVSFFC